MLKERYALLEPFKGVNELVKAWARDVGEDVGSHDANGVYNGYDFEVEDVENQHRSGFIPFTNGGVEVVLCATLSACDGHGSAPTIIQPYLDSAYKDAVADWDRQHHEATVEQIYASDRDHPLREDWHESQSVWLQEGGTFFFKIRALYYHPANSSNESGEEEVFFMVGINTDFGYGRDTIPWLRCYGTNPQQTEWVWEATVKVADLDEDLIKQLTEAAIFNLNNA